MGPRSQASIVRQQMNARVSSLVQSFIGSGGVRQQGPVASGAIAVWRATGIIGSGGVRVAIDGAMEGDGGITPLRVKTDGVTTFIIANELVSTGGGAVTLIDEQSPTGTGTVTFASIPGSFRHLKIVWSGRSTESATNTGGNMQFNGDGGANYDREQASATGSTNTATASIAATSVEAVVNMAAATAPAGAVGSGVIEILNYRNTGLWKAGVALTSYKAATGTLHSIRQGFQWRSVAAITDIVIALTAGDYEADTVFSLYGYN